MDSRTSFQKEEILPSVVSIAVPLVQLISVVIIGLSSTFHVAQLLIFPDILNLVNLLVMLITFSAIGWFWYWRTNINWVASLYNTEKNVYTPPQKVVEKLTRYLIIWSIIVLLFFISMTIIGYLNLFSSFKALWGSLQYISYSLLLMSSGVAIYIWIYEFIQTKKTFQREDFIKNLIGTLGEQGLIPRPDLKLLRNELAKNMSTRLVEIEIDAKKLVLEASFDGREISKIYEKSEYEKLLGQPSTDQLQAQISALLSQIQQLQKESNEDRGLG